MKQRVFFREGRMICSDAAVKRVRIYSQKLLKYAEKR